MYSLNKIKTLPILATFTVNIYLTHLLITKKNIPLKQKSSCKKYLDNVCFCHRTEILAHISPSQN